MLFYLMNKLSRGETWNFQTSTAITNFLSVETIPYKWRNNTWYRAPHDRENLWKMPALVDWSRLLDSTLNNRLHHRSGYEKTKAAFRTMDDSMTQTNRNYCVNRSIAGRRTLTETWAAWLQAAFEKAEHSTQQQINQHNQNSNKNFRKQLDMFFYNAHCESWSSSENTVLWTTVCDTWTSFRGTIGWKWEKQVGKD